MRRREHILQTVALLAGLGGLAFYTVRRGSPFLITLLISLGIVLLYAFLMQIYADVLGQEIKVIEASQAAAQGSAVLASVASGYFDSFQEATKTLCKYNEIIYTPNQSNTEKYDKLYKEYLTVSEFFAKNSILKNLKLQSDQ
jgi:L-ribulokinase